MKEKIFQKGMVIESDTYYKAMESRYDIYLEDCTEINNNIYISTCPAYIGALTVAFMLKDLKNVTLDFGNATLVFHGRIAPFILDGCENMKIINLKVDYDRPFYTQAHVYECDSKHMKIRIDDGFDYRVGNGYLYAVSKTWEKNLNRNDCLLWLYDRTGQKEYPIILALFGPEIFPKENPPLPIGHILLEEEGEYLVLNGNFPESWDYNGGNNSLIFTHEGREKCTVFFVGCKDIYFENFILIHGASYALMGLNTENIYIDNFSMYMNYQNNGRLVTNNADAVHLFNCKGNFVLKNSHMEGLLDDTVNIHGNYLPVLGVNEGKLLCSNPSADASLYCQMFVKGDEVAVYRGRTQELKGRYTLQKIVVDVSKQAFLVSLDKDFEGVEEGDIIENLSGNPNVLIENCEFGRFRGTMRLQSRNKTIVRNCEFCNKETSIVFTGDTTYWFESGPVRDFLMENCRFYGTSHLPRIQFWGEVEYTEEEPYYHRNITFKNCYFDAGVIAVLRHVENCIFEETTSNGEMVVQTMDSTQILCDETIQIIEL